MTETFGDRVASLRRRQHMSQQELADKAQISQGMISRIERGRVQELKANAVSRLADALHVRVDYLVGRPSGLPAEQVVAVDRSAQLLVRALEALGPRARAELVEHALNLLTKQDRAVLANLAMEYEDVINTGLLVKVYDAFGPDAVDAALRYDPNSES